MTNVDSSIVQLYFSQRLQGLDTSVESYEDEVLSLLEVIKILAGEDAELYARSIKDVLSPAAARGVNGTRQSSQVLERAVDIVLSSLRDGKTWDHPYTEMSDADYANQVTALLASMSRQPC